MTILPGIVPSAPTRSSCFDITVGDVGSKPATARGPGRGRGAADVSPPVVHERLATPHTLRLTDKRGYETLEDLLSLGPMNSRTSFDDAPLKLERIAWDEHGRRCVERVASSEQGNFPVPSTPGAAVGSWKDSAGPRSGRGPLRSRGSVAIGLKTSMHAKRHAFIDGLSKEEIVHSPLYDKEGFSVGGVEAFCAAGANAKESGTEYSSVLGSQSPLAATHGTDRMFSVSGVFRDYAPDAKKPGDHDRAPSRGPANTAWTTSLDELKREDIGLYNELNTAKVRMGWNIALDMARGAAVDASEDRALAALNDSMGLGMLSSDFGTSTSERLAVQLQSVGGWRVPTSGSAREHSTGPAQPGVYYGQDKGLGAAGNGSLGVRIPRGMPEVVRYVSEDRPPRTARTEGSRRPLQGFEQNAIRGAFGTGRRPAAALDDENMPGIGGDSNEEFPTARNTAPRKQFVGARPSAVWQKNRNIKLNQGLGMSKCPRFDPEIAKELAQERDVEGANDARAEARLAEERAEDKRKYAAWRSKVVECTRNLQLEVDRFRR